MSTTASQTNVLNKTTGICKEAVDLFGRAGVIAREANATGALTTGFDPEAFTGQLSECTPIDAAAVFAFLQQLDTLINTEVTIAGEKIVLGTAVLKFNLANTNR